MTRLRTMMLEELERRNGGVRPLFSGRGSQLRLAPWREVDGKMYRLPRSGQADKPEKNPPFRLVKQMGMILVIVVSIIVVLVVVQAPGYISAVRLARESVLKEDLQVLRDAIHNYTADKMKRPPSLGDLLAAGYLKQIPEDPMTRSRDTWVTETSAALAGSGGIDDVHSGSQQRGSNGRQYSSW